LAHVVFVQRDPIEWLGIMYLSSALKARGHTTEMIVERLETGDIVDRALDERADVFAFSPLVTDVHWAMATASRLGARSNALIVFGGTHVTLAPEETLAHPEVDVVCLGEGEGPLAELADAIDARGHWHDIANLWVKTDGRIVRNELRDLLDDLDALPFPDRTLYAGYDELRRWSKRPLHLGRGCPFSCSFCHNATKRELVAHKGRYVRWRTVDSVIAEVEDLAAVSSFKVLHFIDDGFGVNHDWLGEFLPRLAALFDDPPAVFASMRAEMVTEELCATFSAYGAHRMRLRIAVECGDEKYRNEVLNKSVTDRDLRSAAELFHEHGIEFATYNMVGLPGETLDQAISTLRLNLDLRPTDAHCFIFQPFPGTPLAQLALNQGVIDSAAMVGQGAEELRGSYESFSPLDQDNITQLENVHRVFGIVVRHPVLFPLARRLVAIRWLEPLLRIVYRAHLRQTLRRRRRADGY
jgi:radical SAM superfamily enzyme YgiQ (UPF0313 family)